MGGKGREGSEKLISWAYHILGIGILITLFSLNLYRGAQVEKLILEVADLREAMGEFKAMVRGLERREERVERVLSRQRRRVGSSNTKPEVLDFRYEADIPESTSNLTIYEKWSSSRQGVSRGLSGHHRVSAAWNGVAAQTSSYGGLSGGQGQGGAGSGQGLGQAFHHRQDLHRSSRVALSGGGAPGHGVLIEVDGKVGGIRTHSQSQSDVKAPTPLPSTSQPPPPAPVNTAEDEISIGGKVFKRPNIKSLDDNRLFGRPEVRSLGLPESSTMELTAIQLEADEQSLEEVTPIKGLHTNWKLASQQMLHCESSRGVGLAISCYTGGLIYLEQGDKVTIVDNRPGMKVDTSEGRTFMGLVKLTQDWI